MSQNPETTTLGIEHYLFVLRRQWGVIAASACIGLLAAVGFLIATPNGVTATTDLNISVISTEPFNAQKSAGGLLDDAAEARIAKSYAVASKAADLAGDSTTGAEIRTASSVVTTAGTSAVRVSFTAASASAAIKGADAVAAAYIDYRSEQADHRIDVMLTKIADRTEELRGDLVEANSRNATAEPGSVDANQAESDRQQISLELEDLLSQKNTLESVDTTGGAVLTPAANNALVAEPARLTVLATGLLAGVVLGLVLAFIINKRDFTLRDAGELDRITDRRTLAVIPRGEMTIPPSGGAADQLRVARERVFAELPPSSKSLLIVDDSGDADFSTAALYFAATAAQVERRVLLITPGITDEQLADITSALELAGAENKDHNFTRYQSELVPYLTVDVPRDIDDPRQSDPLVTRQVRESVAGNGSDTLYMLLVKSEASRSSVLAGLRLCDALLVIARSHHSRSDRVRSLLNAADALATPVVGSIMLGRTRA